MVVKLNGQSVVNNIFIREKRFKLFEYLKDIREIRLIAKSRDWQVFDLADWNVLNLKK